MNFHVAGFHKKYGATFKVESPVYDAGIDLRRDRARGVKGTDPNLRIRLRNPKVVVPRKEPPRRRPVKLESAVYIELEDPALPRITIAAIQNAICAATGLSLMRLKANRRTQDIVVPRQIGMMLCDILTQCSTPQIGRAFGGKDHTTVLHALRKMHAVSDELEKLLKIDDSLALWVLEAIRLTREIQPKTKHRRAACPAPAT